MSRLSRAAQLDGQRQFIRASYVNPLGAGLTIGPLIALLAMHYGADDLMLGLIFAAPHLGNLAAIFGPRMLAGADTSRIMAGVWLWRAFVALGYLSLPFLPGDDLKLAVLIGTCYAFMSLRAFGVTAFYPVLKALSRPRELVAFTSRTQTGWQTGTLVTTVLSFVVLRYADLYPSEEWAYMSLLALGFVFNLTTALLFHRLPPTGALDGGSFRSVGWAFAEVARRPAFREVAWISILGVIGMVAASYQLAYLKQVLLLADDTIFALTLASVLGAIAATRIARVVSEAISIRGMLFATQSGQLCCALCWCLLLDLLSPAWQLPAAAGLFVCSTGLLAVAVSIYASLRAGRLPERQRVQIALVYQMLTVLAAALAIAMVDLGGQLRPAGQAVGYDHAFLIWAACALILALIALRMPGHERLPLLRELLQLHPANLTTLLRMQRIDQQAGDGDDLDVMRELEQLMINHTPAGKHLLLEMLASPEVRRRLHALRALPDEPIAGSLPLVAAEARNPDSPLRQQAITVLGLIGDSSVLPLLRDLLGETSESIRATAHKSLMRLGEPYTAQEVVAAFRRLQESQPRLDLVIGLMHCGDHALLWRLLAIELPRRPHVDWQCALLLAIATAGRRRQRLVDLLGLEREQAGAGIEDCILDLNDSGHVDRSPIAAALRGHRYHDLPRLCRAPQECQPDNPQCAIGLVYCGIIHAEACGAPRSLLGDGRLTGS